MDIALTDKRRDLVRLLHHTKLSVPQIVERLDKHYELFPPYCNYEEKKRFVYDDIRAITQDIMADIAIETFDAKQKHAEYIQELIFLYQKALGDSDYALAFQLAKSKAKAYGIQTDEPIVIKTDLMTAFKSAKDLLDKKRQREIEEKKTIDITPQIVRPTADAILNKRHG